MNFSLVTEPFWPASIMCMACMAFILRKLTYSEGGPPVRISSYARAAVGNRTIEAIEAREARPTSTAARHMCFTEGMIDLLLEARVRARGARAGYGLPRASDSSVVARSASVPVAIAAARR